MNGNLTIIAKITAKPDRVEEVENLLRGLIEPTRAEAGCIRYDLHRDLENPGVFYFYETWASAEDLDKHFQTPHIAHAMSLAGEILAEPLQLHKLEKMA